VRSDASSVLTKTQTWTLMVPTQVTITRQPAAQTVAPGQAATLTLVAGGSGPFTYQWYAGASGNTAAPIASATASSYTTPALNAPARYWARVSNGSGSADTATTLLSVTYTDAILVAHTTPVRAAHLNELRTRVNAVRERLGLSGFPWSAASISIGALIRAQEIIDLRTAITDLYARLGVPTPTYGESIASGAAIKASYFTELRTLLAAIE
jgi:hypothetical protein